MPRFHSFASQCQVPKAQACSVQKHNLSPVRLWLLLLSTIISSATALTIADVCPPSSIYTPFKKWPASILLVSATPSDPAPTENTACWYWAECVQDQAPEVRKQQFAATSLVMGLVPLILKDISWPERRNAPIKSPLNVFAEVLVKALGLIPVLKNDVKQASLPHPLSKWNVGRASLPLLALSVLVAYGALVVMEFFSKRSSLGCPYPLFVCTWYVVALLPASIGTLTSKWFPTGRTTNCGSMASGETSYWCRIVLTPYNDVETFALRRPKFNFQRHTYEMTSLSGEEPGLIVSADADGGEQKWWIRFIWSIYYAAGTLVYSSIMAVTVVELVVWVILSCLTVAASKMLAFRLCGNWK